MREAILVELRNLEFAEQVRVLYAVESGSRAWGFASPDSDYDVRFIYVRPRDWYLSVQRHSDVLERMLENDLDFAGWDLQKALPLLRKSNPSLIEWLASPIVYQEDHEFITEFPALANRCVSLNACFSHYVHMAESNWRTYFDSEFVPLKKYLYVLRPIFACRWIERYQSSPPLEFSSLLQGSAGSTELMREISDLLQAKSSTSELGKGARNSVLDEFAGSEIQRFRDIKLRSPEPIDWEQLDQFFRNHL